MKVTKSSVRRISTALILVAVLMLVSCSREPALFADEPVTDAGIITSVRSIASPLSARGENHSAACVADGNLATCWAVNLQEAREQGFFDGTVLQGLFITLSRPYVGSFCIWSGYWKNSIMLHQNAAAARVSLIDCSDGRQIAEFSVWSDPQICIVDQTLNACHDGKYRIQVNFGSEGKSGIRKGSKFDDLCISEIQVSVSRSVTPVYPVGDRAAYGLKGPVKECGDISFDLDGLTHFYSDAKISFTQGGMVLKSAIRDDESRICRCTDRYDERGFLSSSERDYGGGNVVVFSYEYEESRIVKETVELPSGKILVNKYSYLDGQISAKETFDTADNRLAAETYTVLSADSFGNWTARRIDGSGRTETRTIKYY